MVKLGNLTDIAIASDQMPIFLTLIIFMYFFWVGYQSEKRSGGALMLFSGFLFLYLEVLITSYMDAILVVPLMTPIAILIILLGGNKFLIVKEDKD